MSANALLERLAVAGVTLTPVDGNYLDAEPAEALTDELRALIRQHKADLLALLWNQAAPDQAFPRLDDLCPEGRAAGERIYRALLTPRPQAAQVASVGQQEEGQ